MPHYQKPLQIKECSESHTRVQDGSFNFVKGCFSVNVNTYYILYVGCVINIYNISFNTAFRMFRIDYKENTFLTNKNTVDSYRAYFIITKQLRAPVPIV